MFKTCFTSCCFLLIVIAVITVNHLGEAADRECPTNEFYTDCGADCQTICSELNEPCYIRHFRCPDGCYCNEGYARDDEGKCIPISECPKK